MNSGENKLVCCKVTRVALIALLPFLTSCEDKASLHEEMASLQSQLDASQATLEEAKEKQKELTDSVSDLQSTIGDFETDDWRDVVPNVESAAYDVEEKANDLESILDQ